MSTETPHSIEQDYARDQHLQRDRRFIDVAPLIEIFDIAQPEKARIPSLAPNLYIYNAPRLNSAISKARHMASSRLEVLDPDRNALTRSVLECKIRRYETLSAELDSISKREIPDYVTTAPVDDLTPDEYGYEVKTLRDVFEAAHNYAHKLVHDNAESCFLGAHKAVLKEVAQDHVAAINSRQSGHQYLVTPIAIGSTIVRCELDQQSLPRDTLSNLRKRGIARPRIFIL